MQTQLSVLLEEKIVTDSCQLDCYSWSCSFGCGPLANNWIGPNPGLFKAFSICSYHSTLTLHTDRSCPPQLVPLGLHSPQ